MSKEDRPRSLELRLRGWDSAELVGAGMLAAIPVTTWLATIAVPLANDRQPPGGDAPGPIAIAVFVGAAMFAMLVAPWLVPILVLRRRQPGGARIEWDESGVTEWDGPWRRSVIAWNEMKAGRVTWETKTRGRTFVDEALQLVGPAGARAITVWTDEPPGVPHFRRRLVADVALVTALREAAEDRGVAFDTPPTWLLACDPDRPPHRALTVVGRFGYPLGVLGPLVALGSHGVGIAIALVAAALLAARAVPVLREVRGISARLDGSEDGRAQADRWRLRAAWMELAVRAGCVALLAVSTAVATQVPS